MLYNLFFSYKSKSFSIIADILEYIKIKKSLKQICMLVPLFDIGYFRRTVCAFNLKIKYS